MTLMPVPEEARLHVFIGGYGCGKTELSLNTAFALRDAGHAVVMVDLDIVNPYFRSAERSQPLEAAGVRVIAPVFARTAVDVPALPANIQSVFDGEAERAVFDVGGDDAGAAAAGRYAARIRECAAGVWYVINTLRPMSDTVEANLDRIARVSARSRLQPDGIIHNTNLGDWTDADNLISSYETVKRVSRDSGIPVVAVTGDASLRDRLPEEMRRMFRPIRRYMRPEFFDDLPGASEPDVGR